MKNDRNGTTGTMKANTAGSVLRRGALILRGIRNAASKVVGSAFGVGGLAGRRNRIRVGRCQYAVSGAYVEILVDASSSAPGARLFAYLPDGTYLGEVLDGGREPGIGTVFVVAGIPISITLRSSVGASLIVPCVPYAA